MPRREITTTTHISSVSRLVLLVLVLNMRDEVERFVCFRQQSMIYLAVNSYIQSCVAYLYCVTSLGLAKTEPDTACEWGRESCSKKVSFSATFPQKGFIIVLLSRRRKTFGHRLAEKG